MTKASKKATTIWNFKISVFSKPLNAFSNVWLDCLLWVERHQIMIEGNGN